ncbi:MAG: arabinose 5-phosphate isomerase [Nitrospirae bacterium]|nr:arabinose 5-phosphate isomerase [Nitrospirota bacterium]
MKKTRTRKCKQISFRDSIIDVAKKVLQTEAEALHNLEARLNSDFEPAEASHGDLGMVTERDAIIAISNSGETEELVGLIPFLKRFRVKLISMTGNVNSTLAKASDVTLDISVKEEACPMGIVPTASTTATMAMGDAVAVSLLIKKGLNEKDFALFHPGGSIGKKFFIKVEDLMHSGDHLPLIPPIRRCPGQSSRCHQKDSAMLWWLIRKGR